MKKTNEEFVLEITDRFNGNIVVLDKYIDQHTNLKFYCNKCGIDFISYPQNILHSKYGCKECAKKARRLNSSSHKYGKFVDVYPNLISQWDFSKNVEIDIDNIAAKSGKKVWWICSVCGESYQSKVSAIANGTQKCICHNCYLKSLPQMKVDAYLKNKGSFAEHYPKLLEQWCYELNGGLNPYTLTDKSNKKVWWECKECRHRWKASIAHRTEDKGCPYCARHTKSSLQIKIEDYIRNKYSYTLLNEHGCTLKCYNPKTGYRLLYDNELIIDDDAHLIIECHGQQHYEICGWTYTQAKEENCTPKEILQYQQYKDNYKEQFALENGFYYCIIPYTDEENNLYKKTIDEAIHKILSLTQQNDLPA